jgi:hypothetical protein
MLWHVVRCPVCKALHLVEGDNFRCEIDPSILHESEKSCLNHDDNYLKAQKLFIYVKKMNENAKKASK